ncbi:MAG TPA: universal stress protein [Burkholderiales bacterium]|nr:universal stress protein [Burkholderiales bacterium]
MFKHILIASDGSKLSGIAIKAGVKLAASTGAKVTVYRAVDEELGTFQAEGYTMPKALRERMAREGKARIQGHFDEARGLAGAAGVQCDAVAERTYTPWKGIVDAARKRRCDVIVMASHGWSGVAGVLLGSVTQKVLAHSKLPVLVYR